MLKGKISGSTAYWAKGMAVRHILCLFLFGVITVFSPQARADRRVALVVGNAAYQHATRLQNPVNDAEDVTAKLKKLGFDVTLARDQSSDGFFDAIQVFANKLVGADIALFYYSGHGVQFDGANYLVPVDTRIEGQFSLKRKAVSAQDVVEQMERGAKVSLVFLDACRNNSLLRELEQSLPQQSRGAAANRGLARMESKGSNTLIVFATAPNDVASDGTGSRNSPFTAALLKHIDAPGVVVQEMLTDVSAEVERTTERRQRPEMLVKLTTKVRLASATAPPVPPVETQAGREWKTIDKNSRSELETFLRRHPLAPEADYARSRVSMLPPSEVPKVQQRPNTDPAEPKIPIQKQDENPLPKKASAVSARAPEANKESTRSGQQLGEDDRRSIAQYRARMGFKHFCTIEHDGSKKIDKRWHTYTEAAARPRALKACQAKSDKPSTCRVTYCE